MKITLNHPKSRHGFPVILGDDGKPIEPINVGLRAAMERSGVSPYELAAMTGTTHRNIMRYLDGMVDTPANVLNVMSIALSASPKKAMQSVSGGLTDEEKEVVKMRDRQGLSFAAVGAAIGCSRQYAHVVYKQAMAKKSAKA